MLRLAIREQIIEWINFSAEAIGYQFRAITSFKFRRSQRFKLKCNRFLSALRVISVRKLILQNSTFEWSSWVPTTGYRNRNAYWTNKKSLNRKLKLTKCLGIYWPEHGAAKIARRN